MDVHEQLSPCTGFQWDEGNSNKNWRRHKVTDAECEQVYFNVPLVAAGDAKHSKVETRYYLLGQTDTGRLLSVVFTIRNKLIRVISARDMSQKERRVYQS